MDDRSDRLHPRVALVFLYLLGVAGTAAGITLLFLGMRAGMDVGGMCAEGGPYAIETHCPQGATVGTMLGIFLGLGSAFLAGWEGASIGGGAGSIVLLAWPALFGVLGFNFLQYGFDPPGSDPAWDWSWLICGIIFEVMALGPLLIAVWAARAAGVDGLAGVARAAPGRQRLEARIANAKARRDAHPNAFEPVAPKVHETAESPGEKTEGTDAANTLVDALERLAALHEDASLTDEEYARAKAEIMERAGA